MTNGTAPLALPAGPSLLLHLPPAVVGGVGEGAGGCGLRSDSTFPWFSPQGARGRGVL